MFFKLKGSFTLSISIWFFNSKLSFYPKFQYSLLKLHAGAFTVNQSLYSLKLHSNVALTLKYQIERGKKQDTTEKKTGA